MKDIEGYLFETENEQIVFSQLSYPKDRYMCKCDRDYERGVKVFEKSFINVLHARPTSGKQPGTNILISNPKDDHMIASHGNKCLVSLKKKGVLVLCIFSFGSWTKGYGVFGDTPSEAIKLYHEYTEWLILYHKDPSLHPPAIFSH